MKYKAPKVEEADAPEDDDEDDGIDDPIPALLAVLLLTVSCPECSGVGMVGSERNPQQCQCRRMAYGVALRVLEEEGLVG